MVSTFQAGGRILWLLGKVISVSHYFLQCLCYKTASSRQFSSIKLSSSDYSAPKVCLSIQKIGITHGHVLALPVQQRTRLMSSQQEGGSP